MTDTTTSFDEIINVAISRRKVIFGGSAAAIAAFLSPQLAGVAAAAKGGNSPLAGQPSAGPFTGGVMDFAEVGRTMADTVTVPQGYVADVLYRWGDSIDGRGTPFKGADITLAEQLVSAGQSHDGMHYFPLVSHGPNQRGLLAINHEITETEFLFTDGESNWDAEKSAKSMAAQGVSVIEIKRTGNQWKVVPSKYARRITTLTEMELTGPAAGSGFLKTSADATGTKVYGTANNCANGSTPWGTYLTCEENFNAYFGTTTGGAPTPLQQRYGLAADNFGPPLYLTEDRFDIVTEPNESNRFGYVVEIDPFNPNSVPKKRTALGRIKHENAELVECEDGRVVVYMGDDERAERIYKFVSTYSWKAVGSAVLDEGTLYVAEFDNGPVDGDFAGVGTWIPLTPDNADLLADAEDWTIDRILVNTRGAADVVGGTRMDRPEWVAADPTHPGIVYCTLTNSNLANRPDGSNDANPRANNPNGHIIRWVENGFDPTATSFTFDIFVLAGDPEDPVSQANAQRVATPGIPAFTDPDGLWFDGAGNLFIQTDGGQPSGLNNQMLVASTDGSHAAGNVMIKRMLVGPIGCEVTGIAQSPDGTALFVNIQHPGEEASGSDWPDKVGGLPRSSTVVIRREDGGPVSAPRY
jgi:secreted PhoX family phosphatase